MSLKTSPYVETLYARASRAEKRDGLALHLYFYLVDLYIPFLVFVRCSIKLSYCTAVCWIKLTLKNRFPASWLACFVYIHRSVLCWSLTREIGELLWAGYVSFLLSTPPLQLAIYLVLSIFWHHYCCRFLFCTLHTDPEMWGWTEAYCVSIFSNIPGIILLVGVVVVYKW